MTDDRLPEDDHDGIDPDEVDLVVSALRDLIRKVASPVLKDILLATRSDVACLTAGIEDEEEAHDLDDEIFEEDEDFDEDEFDDVDFDDEDVDLEDDEEAA